VLALTRPSGIQIKFKDLPSQERLKEGFDYCPSTGQLTHKIHHKNLYGKAAGCARTRRNGKKWMVFVSVDGVQYPAHRIIWKWMTGEDPVETIDHINRDPFDNRWENLRLASLWLQAQNREWDATKGHKGVTFSKNLQKWIARKTVDGERVYIGTCKTKDEAVCAMNLFMDKLCEERPEWRAVRP
jgi:hypothetical protein